MIYKSILIWYNHNEISFCFTCKNGRWNVETITILFYIVRTEANQTRHQFRVTFLRSKSNHRCSNSIRIFLFFKWLNNYRGVSDYNKSRNCWIFSIYTYRYLRITSKIALFKCSQNSKTEFIGMKTLFHYFI